VSNPNPPAQPPVRRSRRLGRLARNLTRSDVFLRASAAVVRAMIAAAHSLGQERALRWALRLARTLGPLLSRSIAAAFPDKSAAERTAILAGVWENFARVTVEFIFLEELAAGFDPARPDEGRVTVSGIDQFVALRDDGKPGIIIVPHLANWEILAVVARKFGLKTVIPFRAPANIRVAGEVLARREALMGTLVENSRGAAFRIAAALDQGAHLGMLVDQKLGGGIDVPFFGRPALTNPLAAKLARQYDCPVHGARAIRRPDGGLHLELTGPIGLPRDNGGQIEVFGATAVFNDIVEDWVREHPDQWFWLHDRWKHPPVVL
jgi:Kdo2-lipid IVA lauroyltransferase/acyltransferase